MATTDCKVFKLTLTTLDGEVLETWKVSSGAFHGDYEAYNLENKVAQTDFTNELLTELRRAS